MREDPGRALRVISLVLRRLLGHEIVGLHDVALGEKRKKSDRGRAHLRLEREDPPFGGPCRPRQHADVGEPHQGLDRLEPPGVVVVPRDHYHPLARAGEIEKRPVDDLLGIGRPSVEILIEYLEDDDWVVREAAADLLGKIGDVRAVEPLMKRLEHDKDTGVKELAIKALGLIGDARPSRLYLEAIPIRPLRVYAMEALAKIKDVETLRPYKALFDRLRTDRDGLVAYNAGVIADKLEALAAATTHASSGSDEHE